jgi:hypothetical protein
LLVVLAQTGLPDSSPPHLSAIPSSSTYQTSHFHQTQYWAGVLEQF